MKSFFNHKCKRNTAFAKSVLWMFAFASVTANAYLLEVQDPHSSAIGRQTTVMASDTAQEYTNDLQRTPGVLDGVSQVEVTLNPAVATVVVDMRRLTLEKIESAISQPGYPSKSFADTFGKEAAL